MSYKREFNINIVIIKEPEADDGRKPCSVELQKADGWKPCMPFALLSRKQGGGKEPCVPKCNLIVLRVRTLFSS